MPDSMPSNPPFPVASDQRSLAAIVFTDVVGFSRRVQVEEAMTLKLLERDFVVMRAFCAMHSGTVVKSTGDGLLLFFNSAVQAVEWALKAQRHFADQAAELPAGEVLRHRVGVHLGDVIVGGGDVMGDGVNIAARVQAEAPAGGICISQVVYGVVKNKLKLDVIRLEPRQLKNINEPMQIYRVLLEPPAQQRPVSAPPVAEAAVAVRPGWARTKKWAVLGAVAAGVGVAGFVLLQAQREHERELAGSQDVRAALGAAVRQEMSAPPAEAGPATPAPAGAGEPAAPARAAAVPPAAAAGERYDFAQLTATRAAGAPTSDQERRILQAAGESLAVLEAWTPAALQRYTKESPLHVSPLRGAGLQSSLLFTDASQQLYFAVGGAIRKNQWADLTPETRGAIIASLLRSAPAAPPRDVVRGAEAFAYVNRLPEMAELLIRDRRGP